MNRIVFAWEQGDNHGHLWRLLDCLGTGRRRMGTVVATR